MDPQLPSDAVEMPSHKRTSGFATALSFWKQHDDKLKQGGPPAQSGASVAPKVRLSSSLGVSSALAIDLSEAGVKASTTESTSSRTVSPRTDLPSPSSSGTAPLESPKSFKSYTSPRLLPFNTASSTATSVERSPRNGLEVPAEAALEKSTVPSSPAATSSNHGFESPHSAPLDSTAGISASPGRVEKPIQLPSLRSQSSKYWTSSVDTLGIPSPFAEKLHFTPNSRDEILITTKQTSDIVPAVGITKSPSLGSSGTSSSSDDSIAVAVSTSMAKSASSSVIASTKHRDGNSRALDRLILSSTIKLRLPVPNSANGVPTVPNLQQLDTNSPLLAVEAAPSSPDSKSTADPGSVPPSIKSNASVDSSSTFSTKSSSNHEPTSAPSQVSSIAETPSPTTLSEPGQSAIDLFGRRKSKGNTSSPIVLPSANQGSPMADNSSLPHTTTNMRHIHQMGGSVGALITRTSHRSDIREEKEDLWARSDVFAQELRSDSSSRPGFVKNGSSLSISTSTSSIPSSNASQSSNATKSTIKLGSTTDAISRSLEGSDSTSSVSIRAPKPVKGVDTPDITEGAAASKTRHRSSPPPIGHIAAQSSPSLLTSPNHASASSGTTSGESSDTSPNQDGKLKVENPRHRRRRSSRGSSRRSRSASKPLYDDPVAEEVEPPSPKSDKADSSPDPARPRKIIPIDLTHLTQSGTPSSSPGRDSPASTASSPDTLAHFPRRDRVSTPKTPSTPGSTSSDHSASASKLRVHKPSSSEYLDTRNDLIADVTAPATPPPSRLHKPASPTVNITNDSSDDSALDTATKKRGSLFGSFFFKKKKTSISPSSSKSDLHEKRSKKDKHGSKEDWETSVARPRGNSIADVQHSRGSRDDFSDSSLVDLASLSSQHRYGAGLSDLLGSRESMPIRRSHSSQMLSLPSSPYDSDSDTNSSSLNMSSTEASTMSAQTEGAQTSMAPLFVAPRAALNSSSQSNTSSRTTGPVPNSPSQIPSGRDSPSMLRRRNSLDPTAAKATFRAEGPGKSYDDSSARGYASGLSPADALFISGLKTGKDTRRGKDKRSTGDIPSMSSFSSPPSPKRASSIFGLALDNFVQMPPLSAQLNQSLSFLSPRSPTSEMPPLSPRAECPEWLSLACHTLSTMDNIQLKFDDAFSTTVAFTAKDKNMLRRSIDDGSLDIAQESDSKMIAQAIVTFLEDLPDALCTYKLYQDFASVLQVDEERYRLQLLHTLFWSLPHSHRCAFILVVDFMHVMAGFDDEFVNDAENERRMNILIQLFAPTIFRAKSYSTLHSSPRPYNLGDMKGTNLSSAFSAYSLPTTSAQLVASPSTTTMTPTAAGGSSTSQGASTALPVRATGSLIHGPTTSLSSSSLSAKDPAPSRTNKEQISSRSSSDVEENVASFHLVVAAPTPQSTSPSSKLLEPAPIAASVDSQEVQEHPRSPTIAVEDEVLARSGSAGLVVPSAVVPPLRLPIHAASQPLQRTKSNDEPQRSPGRSPGSSAPNSPSARMTPRSVQVATELLRMVVKNRSSLFCLKTEEYTYDASHPAAAVMLEDGSVDYLFDLLGNPFYRDPDFADAFLLNVGQKLSPEEILARLMMRVRSGDAAKSYVRVRGALLLSAFAKWVHALVDILALHKTFFAELQATVHSSKDEEERYMLSGFLAELTIAISNATHCATPQTPAPALESYIPPLTTPITSQSSEILAEHMTLIDLVQFKQLKLRKGLNDSIAEFLNSEAFVEMGNRFNTVSRWVSYEIVVPSTPKERASRVIYFANVAAALANMNNFHGALAVFTGINSVAVARMQKMIASARKRASKVLDALESLFSMTKNSKSYTDRVKASSMPIIPQIVLCSRMLSSLDETTPSFDENGHMNICKFKDFNRITSELLKYQKSVYYFHKDPALYNALLTLNPISDDEIYELSLKADPKKT